MSDADLRDRNAPLPLPAHVALVLQGGGALGSFQGGIAEALHDASIPIDWVAGISIGAVNAALIAGNPPERRVERLKAFWATVTSALPSFPFPFATDQMRELLNEWSATAVATAGVPGFFSPRAWPPMMAVPGTIEALSFYDTTPLVETLNALVDWDLLNDGPIRLSVGAVEIESGNFYFFDTTKERIDHRHIMASGALPPGLPPVEIDGKWWWDGGVVSNTPLSHVLDNQTEDMLIFQVDLFSSKGVMPRTIMDVAARAKEIQYSSRTRAISDQAMRTRKRREVAARVLAKLPPEWHDDPDVKELTAIAHENAVALVQLIYRATDWEGGSRDYEFSERTRIEHWDAGREAILRTIGKAGVIAHDIVGRHTVVFDTNRADS
ncbi:patatin-like phospholipase family protein [Sphingomonas abietis]|uniref:Patatin-like phospholipase family protein n=1 Tax=Sphingomonas abietis TaxID=3012344 RepID=A0ABY7NM76_9SPHN|nr:patatin-like phospholipase family protein [Sphingomonas abietis]WBO21915.1 patatin-like phospholipase family protein [Sphingomonas abietis]